MINCRDWYKIIELPLCYTRSEKDLIYMGCDSRSDDEKKNFLWAEGKASSDVMLWLIEVVGNIGK